MHVQLSPLEARVLGALIEKEITTPDQYPLSLNALTNACNQKTNRDPVLDLDDREVQAVLDGLSRRHLVMERSGFGSRVVTYRHRRCTGDHNPLQLSSQEVAVMCELMLRGPQTPGELRSHAQRLAAFADLGDIETTLERLSTREDGPFVAKLPRQPGARECRYCQLFTGEPDLEAMAAAGHAEPAPADGEPALVARIRALEEAVAAMRGEIAALRGAPGP